jgi:hypothetical protein
MVYRTRLLFFGIAAAKASLSFSAKESNQRKLPAAPASLKGCALTSGVVAEPDDADFGRLTGDLCFCFMQISLQLSLRGTKQSRTLYSRSV